MENFIDYIEVSNFKSIRHLELTGFKRINLLLGRPNVGKSNLLEALSLFGLPYVWEGSKRLTDLVRLDSQRDLFYDGNITENIHVRLALSCDGRNPIIKEYYLTYTRETNELGIVTLEDLGEVASTKNDFDWFDYTIDTKLKLHHILGTRKEMPVEFIKPYHFDSTVVSKKVKRSFLQPPFGNNLLNVLELIPDLRKLYAQWFRQYGIRLVLDTVSQSLKIQKDKGDDEVFQLPYSSVADTLQRIIFYKTAVASNQNSVLLFEEPEAHAYPPYISEFTQEVIRSATNQFFIVTHSPLIVEQFLSGALDDLGIFMVDFEDGQTVVKGLSTDEIKEVYRYGIDLFFNGESYLA